MQKGTKCLSLYKEIVQQTQKHVLQNLLKTVSKDYKCKISKNRAKFKNQRVDRLRNLKTSNPKEFWKIINSVDKRNTPLPPIGELHDFFKNLNSHDNDQEPFNTECHESLNEINEEINQQISHEEILKATKRLKNNKSPGSDNVKKHNKPIPTNIR